MVPIKNAVINSKLLVGSDLSMRDKYGLNLNKEENSHSFGSGSSFESFGSIGLDDALVILNPFEFTVSPELE